MVSNIIIDQADLGVCLGPDLRPWRGDKSVSNRCCHPHTITWCHWSDPKDSLRRLHWFCYRMILIAQSNQVPWWPPKSGRVAYAHGREIRKSTNRTWTCLISCAIRSPLLNSLTTFGKAIVIRQVFDVSNQELGNGPMVFVLEHHRAVLRRYRFVISNVRQRIALHPQMHSSVSLAKPYSTNWMIDLLSNFWCE